MDVSISYHPSFCALLESIKNTAPKGLIDAEGIGEQLDIHKFSKAFFKTAHTVDVSVDANANVVNNDVIAYQFELPKPYFRLNSFYLLWDALRRQFGLYVANRLVTDQITGAFYINDFGDVGRPYCFNYSVYDIALEGLPMVKKIKSVAPKHLFAFKSQLEQFLVVAANSTLGATGMADMFIVMAHYVEKILATGKDAHFTLASEDDIWAYVKENIGSFVYTVNQPMRGNQSPFTNVSVYDRNFLEELVPHYTFPDGYPPRIETVQRLQRIFLEVMNEELQRTPVTFPVTTACFSVDDEGNILDEGFLNEIAEANLQFGFINIYCGKSSTLSSCCRLRSDTSSEYFNSFGAGSTKIGSLGVVTLNLPRLAYISGPRPASPTEKNKVIAAFLGNLKKAVIDAAYINQAKREIIRERIKHKGLPLYDLGFMDLRKQYSTAGLTGINEALEILGVDILSPEGEELVLAIISTVNATNDQMASLFGTPHNCEQVPAENSSVKLAYKDYLMGFNVEEGHQKYPLYSNQFIPLTTEATILDRIRLQGAFDKHFSGGAICHLNIGERLTDPKDIALLIRECAALGVVYWAINYNLQMCAEGHMSVGTGTVCPTCGAEITDNFTRVVGFLTNTKNWNKVRRTADYPHRQFYPKRLR